MRSTTCRGAATWSTQPAPEARQGVAKGKRLSAQPLDKSDKHDNALKGRSKHHQNMELVVFNRSTVQHLQIFRFARFFAPFQGGRVIDVTQGRRAKRLPLATFCRASRATGIISLMSYHARLMLEHKPTGVDEPDLIRRSSRRAVQ